MKRIYALISLLIFTVLLSSCGVKTPDIESGDGSDSGEVTELTLWTFPVGNWGNPTAVASMLADFHREYPDIHVSVEYLSYDSGDEKINQAVSDGCMPDLVLEGPERLVANWGEKGWMVDLSELWESDTAGAIYGNIREACRHRDGAYYVFPICMSAHCMAINYDMFREAGALRYIDEETHTWTTEDFIGAVQALNAYAAAQEQNISAGIIYCKNQSGDQGTRALVNNLYGGSFTDPEHTSYTVDSEKNKKALQLLYDLEGISFEPSLSAVDAINMFCKKETATCFCWNVSMEVQQTINNPELDFEVFPMAFPTSEDTPKLQGGIWGFGIFDSGSQERITAAKTFIRYMTENDVPYTRAVRATSYWPVRDMDNIYENDMLMTEYSIFTPYMGDYYQITPEWAQARTAWWQLLSKVGTGTDVSEAVKDFPSPVTAMAAVQEPVSSEEAEGLPITEPLEMVFCSGAGAWGTLLTLNPDGSFVGEYSDADMLTVYVCQFHGQFEKVEKLTDASWSLTLKELELDTGHSVGEEWDVPDGDYTFHYISSEPCGFAGMDETALKPGAQFILYSPEAVGHEQGTELYGMEEFQSWMHRHHEFNSDDDILGCWGLQNMETGQGFFADSDE